MNDLDCCTMGFCFLDVDFLCSFVCLTTLAFGLGRVEILSITLFSRLGFVFPELGDTLVFAKVSDRLKAYDL